MVNSLATETYLIKNGKTLQSIAEAHTTVFENSMKRQIDVTGRDETSIQVRIDDLKPNQDKNFHRNRMDIPK